MSRSASYDRLYEHARYFHYPLWIYRPYVARLLKKAAVTPASLVLDVGCGQGFFSYLIRMAGMRVFGVDLSEVGVHAADRVYGRFGIHFLVGDAMNLPFKHEFDCIFVRSLSLYNTEEFRSNSRVTDTLLASVRPGGCLIFVYNTKLDSRDSTSSWRYHSLRDATQHFSSYADHQIFFLSRLDTLILGKHAFNRVAFALNEFISKRFGFGGDLVSIVRKP